MKKRIWTSFAAIPLLAILLLPASAAGPGKFDAQDQRLASDSPVWQYLFVARKSMAQYPVHILGNATEITEPFAVQIQRALQILVTTPKFWHAGQPEPALTDVILKASFQCGISQQHWPVKTSMDDQCAGATLISDWMTQDGITLFTAIINHYWMLSPRIHQSLISSSAHDRNAEQGELITQIRLRGELSFTFDDLKKMSAYFFSHRMITERKLKERPKLRLQLESYYDHADIPELTED